MNVEIAVCYRKDFRVIEISGKMFVTVRKYFSWNQISSAVAGKS